jgi:excisionase family DNA binding protein
MPEEPRDGGGGHEDDDDVLTVEQVAAWLQLSPSRVRQLVHDPAQEFPHMRIGRLLRFRRADVREWIRRQRS